MGENIKDTRNRSFMKYTLLLVDDDLEFRESAHYALSRFNYIPASSIEEAEQKLIVTQVDLILLDLVFDESRADELQGLKFLPELKMQYPDLPVIVMTGYSSTDKAVQAIKLGAEDYFNKKDLVWSDWIDKIINYCKKYQKIKNLEQRQAQLESLIDDSMMIGESQAMQFLKLKLKDLAQNSSDVSIFLEGETGTGKNLAVRYFRRHSHRTKKPYQEVSIYELSPTVLESELFGHVKGAFTGAGEDKTGLFESAEGGLLFLDEIGDYSLAIQSKIMRFIEDKTISPVGSTQKKRLDLQLIMATNRNLPAMVSAGDFRSDLYQRINRVKIRLPALSERKEDIPLLAQHFFEFFRIKEKTNLDSIADTAMEVLMTYNWPGNVRELQSVIWEACTNARLYNDSILLPKHLRHDLHIEPGQQVKTDLGFQERSADMELSAIDAALKETRGNKSEAAKLLGLNSDNLRYRIIVKYQHRMQTNFEPYKFIMKYYITKRGNDE